MRVLTILCCIPAMLFMLQPGLAENGFSAWTAYGECSKTCGGGIRSRTRTCLESSCEGHLEEIENCFMKACPGDRCSDNDPAQCEAVGKERCTERRIRRRCRKSCGMCKEKPSWTEYGPCSVTCGVGLKTRTKASETQSITCKMAACTEYSKWTSYSKCSVRCGGGIHNRTRDCLVGTCTEHLEEIKNCRTNVCKKDKCVDSDATCKSSPPNCSAKKERKRCKKTCGVCEDPPAWSTYGPCSVTCGAGLMTRYKESIPQSITCVLDKCAKVLKPTWREWKEREPCPVTCGGGTKKRFRTCSVPGACTGIDEEEVACATEPCPDIAWTECSKSCGEGTRRRYFCNGTQCEWQFEGCVNAVCPEVSCETFGSNFKRRYNSTHECCDDAQKPLGENCRLQMPEIVSDRRIIGGQDAEEDQWPWMVAIYRPTGEFCGGSLISIKFVLSAAHCFARDSGLPHDVTGWKIYAGVLTLDSLPGDGLKIKKSYIHPDYSYPIADIALAELEDEVTFTKAIRPICLPHGEITPFEATCIVTGWGVSTEDYTITNHLQELAISNFDPKVCIHGYGKYEALKSNVPFLEDNESYICAGSLTRDIDSCLGDSGGPLACQRCDSCSWYVAGVVSFGPNPCALSGVPGIYTKVVYYEDWIFSTTNMTKQSLSCSKA